MLGSLSGFVNITYYCHLLHRIQSNPRLILVLYLRFHMPKQMGVTCRLSYHKTIFGGYVFVPTITIVKNRSSFNLDFSLPAFSYHLSQMLFLLLPHTRTCAHMKLILNANLFCFNSFPLICQITAFLNEYHMNGALIHKPPENVLHCYQFN